MDVEPRWPAISAFVIAWLLPAKTARRTQRVRLPWAYAVHLITVLLTPLLVAALVTWDEVATGYSGGRDWLDQFGHNLAELGNEIARYPAEAGLVIASIFCAVEAIFLALGTLLTPWGARDERVRASFANSLRQTWLHTTHVLPLVFLVGVLVLVTEAADRRVPFDAAWPSYPTTTAPVNSPAWRQYQADLQKWQKQYETAHEEWNRRRLWCARYAGLIIGGACFASLTWFLWALFRAVGARRPIVPIARPPLCEACGYNLTAAPMEGRCPECGEGVVESLGPDARPGTPWQRRRDVGLVRAWWRCSIDPIVRPARFGRQVRLGTAGADHRWFLLIHLLLIFIVTPGGTLGTYLLFMRDRPRSYAAEYLLSYGPVTGWLSAVTAAFVMLSAAAVAGVYYRIVDKRNLMRGTVQIAAYLSGCLVLWAIVSTAAAVAILAGRELFQVLEALLGINGRTIRTMTWLFLNFGCAAVYLRLVLRGSGGLRYANR